MTKRERMSADQRQTAILDASEHLLRTRGWEDVTIADILEAAGISRGGFYHHFESKDDILATLVLRFADASSAAAAYVFAHSGGDSLARLAAFLRGTLQFEIDNAEAVASIVRLARRPGNRVLFVRLSEETEGRILPTLRDLLSEGVESGTFHLADIDLTADLFLRIARTRWLEIPDRGEHGADDVKARLADRLKAERQSFERLLGLPTGSLEYPAPDGCFES